MTGHYQVYHLSTALQNDSLSVSCTDNDDQQDKRSATSAAKYSHQCSTCKDLSVHLYFKTFFFWRPTDLSDSHTWHEPSGCNGHIASSCCHSHHHHSTYHTVGRSSLREKITCEVMNIYNTQYKITGIQMLPFKWLTTSSQGSTEVCGCVGVYL